MTVHDPNTELHDVLTGTRPKRGPHPAVFIVPVLAIAIVGGAWWVRQEAMKPQPVLADVSTCERLLLVASSASPGNFLVCSASAQTIYRQSPTGRQPMSLAANTVYNLPIDGRTRIEGLTGPNMRYGYGGTSCERLNQADGKPVLLNGVPVDRSSC
ncbi:hypothetical protein ACO2Q3_23215 [Caulobacter sp. KR2-114]|uniref:hypothetical protein n=1 Tax=Caulobacter sp. KR2-114 TaxID=3400912 RepID=UPI003BFB7D66